jgi:hypothetical protein
VYNIAAQSVDCTFYVDQKINKVLHLYKFVKKRRKLIIHECIPPLTWINGSGVNNRANVFAPSPFPF